MSSPHHCPAVQEGGGGSSRGQGKQRIDVLFQSLCCLSYSVVTGKVGRGRLGDHFSTASVAQSKWYPLTGSPCGQAAARYLQTRDRARSSSGTPREDAVGRDARGGN